MSAKRQRRIYPRKIVLRSVMWCLKVNIWTQRTRIAVGQIKRQRPSKACFYIFIHSRWDRKRATGKKRDGGGGVHLWYTHIKTHSRFNFEALIVHCVHFICMHIPGLVYTMCKHRNHLVFIKQVFIKQKHLIYSYPS